MRKYLPKSVNNPSGFTLIELLVVIGIIAILSVVGLAVFSGVQSRARDTRRTQDITAIAQALEANKTQNSATYNVLAGTQFQAGVIPADTTTADYCAASATTTTVPGVPTAWLTTVDCPAGYTIVSISNPPATAVSWRVCALLENGTNPTVYCKANQQ